MGEPSLAQDFHPDLYFPPYPSAVHNPPADPWLFGIPKYLLSGCAKYHPLTAAAGYIAYDSINEAK